MVSTNFVRDVSLDVRELFTGFDAGRVVSQSAGVEVSLNENDELIIHSSLGEGFLGFDFQSRGGSLIPLAEDAELRTLGRSCCSQQQI